MMKNKMIRVSASLVALTMMACGGTQTNKTVETSDIPKWALTPPGACGVGISKVRGNLGMAQKTSEARGRDALARQLQTKVQGMIKDYQQSGEAEAKDFTEELTTQVSRQLVDTTLIGTSTRLAHVSTDDPQQYFALVCLQPDAFIGAFDKMNELKGKQRAALKSRAALEFKDLDEQLQKLKE
jgi:basic membrane lipoprotein Med (substrate-binding protein (PBP1-ABC) superfamily)